MARYRITLADRRGRRIGILPAFGSSPITFSTVLNGGGSAVVTPRLTLPLYSGAANRAKLSSWASEIWIERLEGEGQTGLVWEGPVTNPVADVDGDTLTVTCSPVWQWLQTERTINATHTYGGWEQLDVARDLMTKYTTGLGANGDIRMALAPGKTGTKVTEQYSQADNKTAGQAVLDLASVTGGFDFDVLSRFDNATRRTVRTWQWYFPTKGRKVAQVLTKGRGGLRAFTLTEAAQIATRVVGLGEETITKTAATSVEDQYGIHSQQLSLTDSNSQAGLVSQVQDYLNFRTPPVPIITLEYIVCAATPFRFVTTGDSVRVKPDRGWASYDDFVRIIGESTAVDAAGNEIVTLTAAGVPGGIS